jgi:metal-responsive CopG/Arc/MetJ family transcriptional regulator
MTEEYKAKGLRGRKKRYDLIIGVRVPSKLAEKIDYLAYLTGMSRSDVVRMILDRYATKIIEEGAVET